MCWTIVDNIECINTKSYIYGQLLFFKMGSHEHSDCCAWKYNMVFLLFSLAIRTKFQLCFPQKREGSAWIHAGKRDEAVSKRVGCSVLQDGSCLTPANILPKASPLDSPRAFGAALLTLSKRQERHEEKQRKKHKISE